MGNVRTDKPHLTLIYVTCLFKLSFEKGQPGKAIFPLGFQIWKPTGSPASRNFTRLKFATSANTTL